MIFNSKFLLFCCLFGFQSYLSESQKLFVPVEDKEIISIYTKGEKKEDGSYLSRDSEGNIRIKGKFIKLTPVGKWYLFFDDGKLMSNYSYSENGQLDGIFVEYFIYNIQLFKSDYIRSLNKPYENEVTLT